jgi:hypothetical protein
LIDLRACQANFVLCNHFVTVIQQICEKILQLQKS